MGSNPIGDANKIKNPLEKSGGFFYVLMIQNSINLTIILTRINVPNWYNQKKFLFVFMFFQALSFCSTNAEHGSDKSTLQSPICLASADEASLENSTSSRLETLMQVPILNSSVSKSQWQTQEKQVISYDLFCRDRFGMGSNELNNVTWLGYDDFIKKIFSNHNRSDQAVRDLAEEYLCRWGFFKISSRANKFKKKVEDRIAQKNQAEGLKQRAKQEVIDRQNKVIAIEQEAARIKAAESKFLGEQGMHEKLVQQEEQEKLEQALLEQEAQEVLIFYEQIVKNQYQACDFDLVGCPDQALEKQWLDRKEALQETIKQDYKQYDQAFNLTPQTVGFLAAHDIDYHDKQGFFGTALQQQLHGEMCDIFSQAAIMHQQFPYQNNLQASVVEFAGAAYDANKGEQVLLASQLMDVDWIVLKLSREIVAAALPYAQAVASGVTHSATDFFYMTAHPIETCHGLGKALYYVAETIVLNSYEEIEGFEDIYEPLREQRNAEILQALRTLGGQLANSTGPQRLEALTHFGADFIVPRKIIHAVGGICGAIRSQTKVMRAVEGAASALKNELWLESATQELILVTENLEVMAQDCVRQSVATEIRQVKDVIKKRIKSKKVTNDIAVVDKFPKADTLKLLEKNLKIAESASVKAKRTEVLLDGRVRYYRAEAASSTPGPTRGSSYVTEYDPNNGVIRGWYESYDHAGKINRVHPKMIDSKNIDSLHYPHTGKELEDLAKKAKGGK
ncbi:MAG: hypothetical protein NTU89_02500 [Candidatus Dependentiae bacterium]|nr:hypothetical protein [Candidatus Dependentiae bacterium]